MTPIMLNDLPNEIILNIVRHLMRGGMVPRHIRPLHNARLVSKRFNSLVTPILFSRFIVLTSRLPREQYLQEIESDLITGRTDVFMHTVTLGIGILNFWKDIDPDMPWINLLKITIPRLPQLRQVRWTCFPDGACPAEMFNDLLSLLGSVPTLSRFSITPSHRTSPHMSFEPISGLAQFGLIWRGIDGPDPAFVSEISSLLSRCPGLEHLWFKIANDYHRGGKFGPPVQLKHILAALSLADFSVRLKSLQTRAIIFTPDDFRNHLRHFRYLQILEIELDTSPSSATHIGEICAVLRHENIHLLSFMADALNHPSVFDYLSSYSGLERLTLRPSHSLDDSSALVDQFFHRALPNHASSLRSLELGIDRPSSWTVALDHSQLEEVRKCQQLTELRCWMTITLDDVANKNDGVLTSWLAVASSLPRLITFTSRPTTGRPHELTWVVAGAETYNVANDKITPVVNPFVLNVVERFRQANNPHYEHIF